MDNLLNLIKIGAPVIIPLLAVLAGTGWLQYWLVRQRETRERYRTVLEDFLEPLEGILQERQKLLEELRNDLVLNDLEGTPAVIKGYFTVLPDDDLRKLLWRSHIERLQAEHRRALELIERFQGRIILERFQEACEKFRADALSRVTPTENTGGMLFGPPFPKELEPALRAELTVLRRRVGAQ